jgi:hypothetical protein
MVAEKTFSALQSRALRGGKTGGRAYGYQEGEAETVRKIFEWYASGRSARWIAQTLNEQDIPSPGASWNRTQRRRGTRPFAKPSDTVERLVKQFGDASKA